MCGCVVDITCITTVMCRLGKGTCSEKCVVKQFCRRVSIIECITQIYVGSTAYYIPRVYGIAYCS